MLKMISVCFVLIVVVVIGDHRPASCKIKAFIVKEHRYVWTSSSIQMWFRTVVVNSSITNHTEMSLTEQLLRSDQNLKPDPLWSVLK